MLLKKAFFTICEDVCEEQDLHPFRTIVRYHFRRPALERAVKFIEYEVLTPVKRSPILLPSQRRGNVKDCACQVQSKNQISRWVLAHLNEK